MIEQQKKPSRPPRHNGYKLIFYISMYNIVPNPPYVFNSNYNDRGGVYDD